jgi:hypothetical protein
MTQIPASLLSYISYLNPFLLAVPLFSLLHVVEAPQLAFFLVLYLSLLLSVYQKGTYVFYRRQSAVLVIESVPQLINEIPPAPTCWALLLSISLHLSITTSGTPPSKHIAVPLTLILLFAKCLVINILINCSYNWGQNTQKFLFYNWRNHECLAVSVTCMIEGNEHSLHSSLTKLHQSTKYRTLGFQALV